MLICGLFVIKTANYNTNILLQNNKKHMNSNVAFIKVSNSQLDVKDKQIFCQLI